MSEKTDIVNLLRDEEWEIRWPEGRGMALEAADKIEQLRLERDRALEGQSLANDLVRLLQNEVRW
jgi:hypothetical protein